MSFQMTFCAHDHQTETNNMMCRKPRHDMLMESSELLPSDTHPDTQTHTKKHLIVVVEVPPELQII